MRAQLLNAIFEISKLSKVYSDWLKKHRSCHFLEFLKLITTKIKIIIYYQICMYKGKIMFVKKKILPLIIEQMYVQRRMHFNAPIA